MRIGFTFDLRSTYLAEGYGEEETAEFDREETIDAMEAALRESGHEIDRIGHARQLVQRLAAGDRWDLVFNICEGLHGFGREAQVPSLLDIYAIPYTFSDSLVTSLCLHKGLTKTIVRQAELPTPDFLVVHQASEIDGQWEDFPCFVKPVAEGTGKGTDSSSVVSDSATLRQVCRNLIARFRQPVLVETFLPGREFTVGLIGTGAQAQVLGTLEIRLRPEAEQQVYSYQNKEQSEQLVDYRFVTRAEEAVRQAEQIALAAWRVLGCRDGGRLDLRCNAAGQPQFLEVNPLAGMHPTHSDLPMIAQAVGMPYTELLRRIVDSAILRRHASVLPKAHTGLPAHANHLRHECRNAADHALPSVIPSSTRVRLS